MTKTRKTIRGVVFLRETHRERLLGAGGEHNNQPSMGVAKVMDRTAAGEG
jgi:hypothetical protein